MIQIGIVSKIWQRPRLTRIFLEYYSAFQVPGVRFVRVAAVSPDDDSKALPMVVEHLDKWADSCDGWFFVNAPNLPLAEKGNVACHSLQGHDSWPDLVINVGSDDFVSREYVETVVRHVEAGADFIVPSGLYIYDAPTNRCCFLWNNHGLKAGAAFSARLLNAVGWAPWLRGGDNPDRDIEERLRTVRINGRPVEATYIKGEPGVVLDIKGGEGNLGSYEEAGASHFSKDVDGNALFRDHFPGLLQELTDAGLTCVPH